VSQDDSDEESHQKSKKKKEKKLSRADIDEMRTTRPESGTPVITGGKRSISDAITPTEKYAYILPSVYWIHSLPTRNTKNPKKVSVPSGLRANYEKPAYHNPNQELDSNDGEDSPVRYGGLIRDDEGDKVEKRGVKKSGAKKSNDENVEFCSFIYMLSTFNLSSLRL
jgi:hypothetical protein